MPALVFEVLCACLQNASSSTAQYRWENLLVQAPINVQCIENGVLEMEQLEPLLA